MNLYQYTGDGRRSKVNSTNPRLSRTNIRRRSGKYNTPGRSVVSVDRGTGQQYGVEVRLKTEGDRDQDVPQCVAAEEIVQRVSQ